LPLFDDLVEILPPQHPGEKLGMVNISYADHFWKLPFFATGIGEKCFTP